MRLSGPGLRQQETDGQASLGRRNYSGLIVCHSSPVKSGPVELDPVPKRNREDPRNVICLKKKSRPEQNAPHFVDRFVSTDPS